MRPMRLEGRKDEVFLVVWEAPPYNESKLSHVLQSRAQCACAIRASAY